MNNIELYTGDDKKLSMSEERVLQRITEWLRQNNVPAVVLTNFWLGRTQIDIFVGTPTITLQVEVKGHRRRISGLQNGRWETTDREGNTKTYKNGYLQALAANQTLRDHMRQFLRTVDDIPYPNGVVVFDANIPQGSVLYDDERVRICGVDQLDQVLSSPSRNPWPLGWIRDFAHKEKFIPQPLPAQAPTAPSSGSSFATPSKPRPVTVTSLQPSKSQTESSRATIESLPSAREISIAAATTAEPRIATVTPTYITVVLEPGHADPLNPTSRKSRSWGSFLRYSPVVFALLAAIILFKRELYPASSQESTAANLTQSAPSGRTDAASRHVGSHHHAQKNHMNGNQTKQDPTAGTAVREQPTQTSALPPAPITCPAGVDRLGCNAKVGVLAAPDCPVGFHVSADTCIRDGNT